MGFDIYQIQSLADNCFALHWLRPLTLGGANGLFAQHLPMITGFGELWELSEQEVLHLAGEKDVATKGVFFNLTPKSTDQANLYHLHRVSGRTKSMLTDAIFHFKVACARRNRAKITGANGELIVGDWSRNPVRLEQLRLEGGSHGGTWTWSEPPLGVSAMVV